MNNHTVRHGIEFGMAILLLTGSAGYSQMDQKFVDSQRRNAKELMQYTWKSRVDLQKGSETKYVQLTQIRYNTDGTLQKTLISSTPQQQLPTRGILGRLAQKMREDIIEKLQSLETLARSYGDLPSDKMQQFIATAIVTPEMAQQKLLRVKGSDVLEPGDSMTVWVDSVTRKLRKVEIQTTFEKKRVNIVSDFQDLPQGPTYIARSVIDYPSEELKLIAENSDYERLTR